MRFISRFTRSCTLIINGARAAVLVVRKVEAYERPSAAPSKSLVAHTLVEVILRMQGEMNPRASARSKTEKREHGTVLTAFLGERLLAGDLAFFSRCTMSLC